MKRGSHMSVAIFAMVAMLGLSASARAAGGVIEINQAVVNAAGGFPYNISANGSYRLSGNLTVSSTTADAIVIGSSVNNVTIDLNGFSITGPGGANTGNGIHQLGFGLLTVENGSITGFSGGGSSGNGVTTFSNAIVRNMQVSGNDVGIDVPSGVISGNTANNNVIGIYCTSGGCVISGNTANNNSSHGINYNGSGSVITGNTALTNGGIGLLGGDSTNAYGGNVMNGNGFKDVQGGTSLGNNLCSGTIC